MPTSKEIEEVVHAVVKNGLHFLKKSVNELASSPVDAAVHFALGLELVLKARVMQEHWALVSTQPGSTRWTALRDGDAMTIGAAALIGTLEGVVGLDLRRQKASFTDVFKHRNQIVHFRPKTEELKMVQTQCNAWYYLHDLLTGPWKSEMASFQSAIGHLDRQMHGHRQFLKSKFDQLEVRLKGQASRLLLGSCPSCEFDAVAVHDGDFLSDGECLVCLFEGPFGRCDCCGHWLALESLPELCKCGTGLSAEGLADAIAPQSQFDHGEGRDAAWCGECLPMEATVVPWKDEYRCTSCGVVHVGIFEFCECCNQPWMGLAMQHTFYLGCEHCDGYRPD